GTGCGAEVLAVLRQAEARRDPGAGRCPGRSPGCGSGTGGRPPPVRVAPDFGARAPARGGAAPGHDQPGPGTTWLALPGTPPGAAGGAGTAAVPDHDHRLLPADRARAHELG